MARGQRALYPQDAGGAAAPHRAADPAEGSEAGDADGAGSAGWVGWLMGQRLRPLRFLLVGGVTALVQLALLAALLDQRWPSLVGNGAALAVAMQVNFALNATFTWGDRWDAPLLGEHARRSEWWVALSRWGRFMLAAAGTVALNEVGFDFVQVLLPALVAAAVTSAAIAGLNYLVVGRLVFRQIPTA